METIREQHLKREETGSNTRLGILTCPLISFMGRTWTFASALLVVRRDRISWSSMQLRIDFLSLLTQMEQLRLSAMALNTLSLPAM